MEAAGWASCPAQPAPSLQSVRQVPADTLPSSPAPRSRVHGSAEGPVQPPGLRRPAGEAAGADARVGWRAHRQAGSCMLSGAPTAHRRLVAGQLVHTVTRCHPPLPPSPAHRPTCTVPLPTCPQSEGGFPDFDADVRSNYLFNSTIAGIDAADAILLVRGRASPGGRRAGGLAEARRRVAGADASSQRCTQCPEYHQQDAHPCRVPLTPQIGTNPRIEAPVLNARIRAGACVCRFGLVCNVPGLVRAHLALWWPVVLGLCLLSCTAPNAPLTCPLLPTPPLPQPTWRACRWRRWASSTT